jgi:hypothetical protein
MNYGAAAAGTYDPAANRLSVPRTATDLINKAMSIGDLLNVQAKALTEAHAVVDQLTERLRPVLAPLPQGSSVATAVQPPEPIQISARIANYNDGLTALVARMSALIQQLEV